MRLLLRPTSVMGKEGLKEVANLPAKSTMQLKSYLLPANLPKHQMRLYKEFAIRALNEPVQKINERLLKHGIIGGLDLERYYPEMKGYWLLAVTEKCTKQEIDDMVRIAVGGEC